MKHLLLKSISITTVLIIGFSSVGEAVAAPTAAPANPSNSTGQALEISPPVIDLTANPGQVINTTLRIRNIARGDLIVSGEVDDFVADGEDGRPKLLLNQTEVDPYSLKPWVRTVPKLRLVPREVKAMNITIAVPANASPGGHYGVIRFTATPPDLEGTGVALSASLGTLALIKVNGQISEKLSLAEFSTSQDHKTKWFFESMPIDFSTRVRNEGNVHVQPSGQIHLTDLFGHKVATMNVNLPPRNVLPRSIRRFDNTLDKQVLGHKILFGYYHAKVDLAYGVSRQHVTGNLGFWVIPYRLILFVVIALIILYFVLRQMLRRYNQHIIRQSSKSTKSGRRR